MPTREGQLVSTSSFETRTRRRMHLLEATGPRSGGKVGRLPARASAVALTSWPHEARLAYLSLREDTPEHLTPRFAGSAPPAPTESQEEPERGADRSAQEPDRPTALHGHRNQNSWARRAAPQVPLALPAPACPTDVLVGQCGGSSSADRGVTHTFQFLSSMHPGFKVSNMASRVVQ